MSEFRGDPVVVFHGSACKDDIPAMSYGDIRDLLQSVNVGGKSGDDDPAGGILYESVEIFPDKLFGEGKSFLL